MTNDIGKNDAVLCIEEDRSECGTISVTVGRVYFVEEVVNLEDADPCTIHQDACGAVGLLLDGVKAPEDVYWCLACFTKAGRRGQFDQLLVCDPVEELA